MSVAYICTEINDVVVPILTFVKYIHKKGSLDIGVMCSFIAVTVNMVEKTLIKQKTTNKKTILMNIPPLEI